MASMDEFIAFKATIALLKENNMQYIIDDVYGKCKKQEKNSTGELKNYVKEIYSPFTADQISKKIVDLLKPDDVTCEVEIIYQSLEGLLQSCPNNKGNWYFSGDYPTEGGKKLVNKSFINYYEKQTKNSLLLF